MVLLRSDTAANLRYAANSIVEAEAGLCREITNETWATSKATLEWNVEYDVGEIIEAPILDIGPLVVKRPVPPKDEMKDLEEKKGKSTKFWHQDVTEGAKTMIMRKHFHNRYVLASHAPTPCVTCARSRTRAANG